MLALVTVVVWAIVFLIPSGQYETDPDGAPVPGSYERTDAPLDFDERVRDLFLSPVNGLYGVQDQETAFIGPDNSGVLFGAAGVFLFVLTMGAFMTTVFATGSMDRGIARLAHSVRDRGWLMIVVIMSLFALLGSTMGFAEETLGFYALTVPLTLALGYDRIVAFAVTFLGSGVGLIGSTINPFSIGVASGEAGISIGDGIGLRLVLLVVLTAITIAYVLRYAAKVRADPESSIVGIADEDRELAATAGAAEPEPLTGRDKLVLTMTGLTFGLLVFSVIPWASILKGGETDAEYEVTHSTEVEPYAWELGWWFPELIAMFIVATVLVGIAGRLGEKGVSKSIAKGAGDFIGPAIAIMLARGVSVIMSNTQTIDTVLNAMEGVVSGSSAAVFTFLITAVNVPLAFLIPSSSGHAALAMPILAPLGDFADVDRSLVVTSWNVGSRWIGLILPTSGVVIGGLALAQVGYDRYLRFVWPLMLILIAVAIVLVAIAAAVS